MGVEFVKERLKAATSDRHQKKLIWSKESFKVFCTYLSTEVTRHQGDRLDAKMMRWSFTLWDNHDVTSDAIKTEGYSKPKRQSNKIADTQQNICFEEAHEFSRSDVGMEMLSSFLQEAKIPTRQMQHGAMPSSRVCSLALLATFPRKRFTVHVHILQVGESSQKSISSTALLSLLNTEVQF